MKSWIALLLMSSFTKALFRFFPKPTKPTLHKIHGFYGLIGPDVDTAKTESLYDLFTGNGVIQGVFFEDGKITFVKHHIRTE